jgi:DNA replication and repair protein RecF
LRLTRLLIRDFRNLAAVDLTPHGRFNVLAGDNGQGKTNLLEAVYWLATLRPLRAARLRELVRFGAEGTSVGGRVVTDGLEHRLEVRVSDGDRVALREGKNTRAADYFGALAVVVFTPEDVGLVGASPQARRGFLDRAVFNTRPAHLGDVNDYRRALDSRNTLLRQGAPAAVVEAYETTLAAAGARVMRSRAGYVERFAPVFATAFRGIVGDEVEAEVRYRPSVEDAAGLARLWATDRERDRQRGFTQQGPHADDLELRLLGRPARAYASQGQRRALVLALKIAEIRVLTETAGLTPVLLLDDVSSELDAVRNERLFEFLHGFPGQVFITTTDAAWLRLERDVRTFSVAAGQVVPAAGSD